MLTQKNQIINKINQANNILLLTRKTYSGDSFSALLAWHLFLNHLGKKNDLVIDDFQIRSEYKFLPSWAEVKPGLSKLKKFTIAVDISQTKLEELTYDVQDNEVLVHLTPAKGFFDNQDIHFKNTDFKYDLVICLGLQDFESLGSIYQEHADFLYQVPIINIDNHHLNEHFGNINEIDITKTSVAEISYDLMQQASADLIDKDIANCLLTGVIQATHSFKSANVNPQTLHLASELINLGASRKEIVDHLYNTKSVTTLKLWGRVLARLKIDNNYKIAWSIINHNDFLRSGAQEEDLPGVIDEVIMTSPQVEIVVIFYISEYGQAKIYLYSSRNFDSLQLANNYRPQGDKDLATFNLGLPIEQAEAEVIQAVRDKLKLLLP